MASGGPQAHVAILRDHLVDQRDWLDEEQFTELFAIGQVRAVPCSVRAVRAVFATTTARAFGVVVVFLQLPIWNRSHTTYL